MTDKKVKLHTPNEELSEYENFKELAKKLVRIKKSDIEKSDKNKVKKETQKTSKDSD